MSVLTFTYVVQADGSQPQNPYADTPKRSKRLRNEKDD